MTTLRTILAALTLFAASAQAQTLKSLMYNTTNGQVVYSGTNDLNFSYPTTFNDDVSGNAFESSSGSNSVRFDSASIQFSGSAAAATRTNLSLGATWLTNGNVTNFRTAIGLGVSNSVIFNDLILEELSIGADGISFQNEDGKANTRANLGLGATNNVTFGGVATAANGSIQAGFDGTNSVAITISSSGFSIEGNVPSVFELIGTNLAATIRKDFGLGATNIVTFAGLTNNGDIRINQTTTNNGLLYINRTNSEAFLGLANLIASNNTTISNETLFRVGVSEATNKAAQFGFRSTNTNGNGVAVFSVFGFNALMMVGADASTNAVVYSGGGTNNEVMTLIRDGATEFARPIRFSTNAATKPATNAPTVTTNVAAWVEMRIGTNSYRVPLYQ